MSWGPINEPIWLEVQFSMKFSMAWILLNTKCDIYNIYPRRELYIMLLLFENQNPSLKLYITSRTKNIFIRKHFHNLRITEKYHYWHSTPLFNSIQIPSGSHHFTYFHVLSVLEIIFSSDYLLLEKKVIRKIVNDIMHIKSIKNHLNNQIYLATTDFRKNFYI